MNKPLCAFRTSDGVNIRFTIDDFTQPWSKPDTLVLLHATMGSLRRLYGWVPHLAGHYRVVRWDMRGHGESDQLGENKLSIERLTLDLVELLDHLGVERAHVAGSSAGGIIAMHAAITHPARLKTIASYAAIPGLRPSAGHTDYEDWIGGLEKEGVRAFLRRTIRYRFDLSRTEPEFVEWFIDEAARNDARSLARFLRMWTLLDFGDRLTEIRCPSLFVVPSGDPSQSMEHYAVLKSVPDHRLIVYEDLPHNITDAVPERCAKDLAAFLEHFERRQAAA